jgi:hypothetical protein
MSDVVIRNMKMPKSCESCPLSIEDSLGENFFCARQIGVRFSIELSRQRQETCPLAELPPHGRLIDADKLKQALSHVKGNQRQWYFAEACQFIDEAETVLEASKT